MTDSMDFVETLAVFFSEAGGFVANLKKKDPYEVTLKSVLPPYLDYAYFQDCDQVPFRYNVGIFEMINAWWLIEASTLAYAEPDFVTDVFKRKAGFQNVEFFSDRTTQCYVASNDNFVLVAFRGSEIQLREGDFDAGYLWADWLTNFNFLAQQWDRGGTVHGGFKAALDEVWEELAEYVADLQKGNRTVWITGHSQGAALATLAADRYKDVQGLYTFGSPRVGDEKFKTGFRIDAYRFVNKSDIVTRVPPHGLYCHVGKLKYIDDDGVIQDDASPWERWTDEIEYNIKKLFNAVNPDGRGLTDLLIEPIVDHLPPVYAINIWNNIPGVN